MTSNPKSKNFKSFFLDNFQVKKKQSFISWCEKNIWLPSEASSSPGQFNLSLTPYMKEIYSLLDHGHQGPIELVLLFGSQLGKTQLCLNYSLYCQCHEPAPLMMVLPTISLGQKFSKQRLTPMIESCPEAINLLKQDVGRSSSQTMDVKRFYGGVIFIVGSNSKANLSSYPIRYLITDEIDKFELDLGGEGSPLDMASARTLTFNNRVIIYSSTPSIKGLSAIENKFNESDKNYYHVPCPYCNSFQTLVIENLTEKGYSCAKCSKVIDEKNKIEMLKAGKWISSAKSKVRGFQLNGLYSTMGGSDWSYIYDQKIKSMEDENKYKTFTNLILGKTYEEKGSDLDPNEVKAKCIHDYPLKQVPDGAKALIMSMDIQQNRVEFLVTAWCKKLNCYAIDFGIIPGRIKDDEVKDLLKSVAFQDYFDSVGNPYKINKVMVDSGFDTGDCYLFCRELGNDAIPIKGMSGLPTQISLPRPIDIRKSGKKYLKSGVLLRHVGVDILKREIYTSLDMDSEKYKNPRVWRRIFFPKEFTDEFFLQLCAEKLVKEFKKGTLEFTYKWRLKRARNEALDLMVYALAGAYLLKLNVEERKRPTGQIKNPYKGEDSQLDFEL